MRVREINKWVTALGLAVSFECHSYHSGFTQFLFSFFFLSTFAQREPIHFDALTLTQSGVQWADARSFLLAPRESDLQEKYQEVKTKRTELVTEIHATCPVDSSILPGKTGAHKK